MNRFYEPFMLVCFCGFIVIIVSIFVITIIKFIRYIRAELKREYGEIDRALIVASVIGLIMIAALTVLILYLSITTIKELNITQTIIAGG